MHFTCRSGCLPCLISIAYCPHICFIEIIGNTSSKRSRGRPSRRVQIELYLLNALVDVLPTTAEQKELERIGLGEYIFKYSYCKIFILGLQVLHNLLKIKFQSKFWIYSGFCIKVW